MCYFEEEEQLREVHLVVNLERETIEVFTSEALAKEYAKVRGGSIHKRRLDPKTERRWAVNFRLEENGKLNVFTNESVHQTGVNLRFESVQQTVGQWCVHVSAVTKGDAEELAKSLFKELVS